MDIVCSYTAAVRGYHYYKQFWKPVENEELHCYHEKYNLYDKFGIKTVHENGETVGHLPREISRVTKFFLDRGVSMHIKLLSSCFKSLKKFVLGSRWYGNPMYCVLQHAINFKKCTTSGTISAVS